VNLAPHLQGENAAWGDSGPGKTAGSRHTFSNQRGTYQTSGCTKINFICVISQDTVLGFVTWNGFPGQGFVFEAGTMKRKRRVL